VARWSGPAASAGSIDFTSSWDSISRVPLPDASWAGLIVWASTVTQTRPSAIVIACGLPPTAILA
jgi:hypothetical protein